MVQDGLDLRQEVGGLELLDGVVSPADADEAERGAALIRLVVAQSTGQCLPVIKPSPKKNPAAVGLGRLGGKKSGKARAAMLPAEIRSAIARKGSLARWKPKNPS